MGHGTWTTASYCDYSTTKGYNMTTSTSGINILNTAYTVQDLFKERRLNSALNPYNIVRECCDTEEHPETIPVILALDVTGSMGSGAAEVAKKLNEVMTELYDKVKDVEFCVMGIGDLAYDDTPIQMSQFESDIRIAEHLDKVYFEGGGGGNRYESYTAAWYMGLNHTALDCWKRGKKGIIITMGDEMLNPYLPYNELNGATGDKNQANVETDDLYARASEKFDIYHIAVNDKLTSYRYHQSDINSKNSYGKYLDEDHFLTRSIDSIAATIVDIITRSAAGVPMEPIGSTNTNAEGEIVW